MKIAVIGGGLVGRLAAWAVMQSGHSPVIFDRMDTAVTPRGFVFLHDPCGLPMKAETIHILEQGTAEAYAEKVYDGRLTGKQVSFGKYAGVREGYQPAEALAMLNGLQHGMVKDRNFENWDEILELRENFERVIFTLPINRFFEGRWLSRRGSVASFKLDEGEVLKNFCVYNSNPDIPWHRAGSMFGYAFYEYPVVISGHQPIVKVQPGGSLLPSVERVLFTGRFGRWNKDILSHHAYEQVLEWLA